MNQKKEKTIFKSFDHPIISFKNWELFLNSYDEVNKIQSKDGFKNIMLDCIHHNISFIVDQIQRPTSYFSMEITKQKNVLNFTTIKRKQVNISHFFGCHLYYLYLICC